MVRNIIVWTHPSAESSSLANPPFLELEAMKSKHGHILVLPTDDDGCWNAEKMVNQTESYRLFNNAISLCSFSSILYGMLAACEAKEAVVANRVNFQPRPK
jgi:hypothetical protein